MLELRSKNDIELHVEEMKKRGNQILIGGKQYKLSELDAHKKDIPKDLKSSIYHNLEDMVYRFQLAYNEIIDILDLENIPSKGTGSSLNLGIYEITDVNKTLEYNI